MVTAIKILTIVNEVLIIVATTSGSNPKIVSEFSMNIGYMHKCSRIKMKSEQKRNIRSAFSTMPIFVP